MTALCDPSLLCCFCFVFTFRRSHSPPATAAFSRAQRRVSFDASDRDKAALPTKSGVTHWRSPAVQGFVQLRGHEVVPPGGTRGIGPGARSRLRSHRDPEPRRPLAGPRLLPGACARPPSASLPTADRVAPPCPGGGPPEPMREPLGNVFRARLADAPPESPDGRLPMHRHRSRSTGHAS